MAITRIYRTLGFSVPPDIAVRIENEAKARHLTKSEFFREIFRAWETWEAEEERDRADETLVTKTIAEVEEEKRTHPKTPEELMAEFRELQEDCVRRNKELGINDTEDDIVRMIREDRKRRGRRKRALRHLSQPEHETGAATKEDTPSR